MKGLFNKLLKSLGFSRRDLAVLLPALLLAFSIWLIHNLSLKYNDFLTVPVTAKCSVEGHSNLSSNQYQVMARCRTTGYNVLKHKLFGRKRVRLVEFKPESMKHLKGDVFYVTSSDLQEYSHVIFGDDVTIEYFGSDTLQFTFATVDHKKVPVHPVSSISYEDQYTKVGDLVVKPDSVTLYGELNALKHIERVYTMPLRKTDLDTDIQGVIGLEPVRNVRLSTDEVSYSLEVARYVEMRGEVKVETRNVPADKEMVIIPSRVQATMKCRFPLAGDPVSSLVLYVDYEDFLQTVSGKCPVRSSSLPEGVISYELEPFYVECIVRER